MSLVRPMSSRLRRNVRRSSIIVVLALSSSLIAATAQAQAPTWVSAWIGRGPLSTTITTDHTFTDPVPDLTGRTLVLFPEKSARTLCDILFRRSAGTTGEFGEMEQSGLKEAGNILASASPRLTRLPTETRIRAIGPEIGERT